MPEKFNADLYKVKANVLDLDDTVTDEIVCGFYYKNVCDFVDVENENYEEKLDYPTKAVTINAYSICRNTGIVVGETYLYEFDLVRFTRRSGPVEMGVVVFDDFRKSYCVQGNGNYSGKTVLADVSIIEIIGNVVLSTADGDKFQAYSDAQDTGYTGTHKDTECRSRQRLNRLAKQFL